MNIEIINASLVKEDYDILINFLDRMNFNYTTNEGEERKFSLEEALGMLMEFAVLYHKSERKDIANDAAEYLTDKFNIDI